MEQNGRKRLADKSIHPQQVQYTPLYALARREGGFSLGYFRGVPAFIDLDKLVIQPLVLAEKAYCLDRIDSRNGVQVTVPNGSAIGAVVTGEIEVPTGEVWYLNRLSVTCPAADATGSASHNILVSPWPKTAAGIDKGYLATAVVAMGATTNYDVAVAGQLGEELRLVGGDKLTLQLAVTVAFTADKVFRLDAYGRVGKTLVT